MAENQAQDHPAGAEIHGTAQGDKNQETTAQQFSVSSREQLMEMKADELRERASALNVEGVSSKNKEELANAIISAETANISESQMDSVASSTGEILSEQPKRTVRLYQVPKGSTDSPLPDEVVQINGYTYQLQRGVDVEVPQSVYEVLEQGGRL